MKFNSLYKVVIMSLFVALAGCGGEYSAANWAHYNIETDWDIDSAVCLAESEKLTKDDLETIAETKRSAALGNDNMQANVNSLQSAYGSSDLLDALSGLSSAFSSFTEITAEDAHKTNKFERCLTSKGWRKK